MPRAKTMHGVYFHEGVNVVHMRFKQQSGPSLFFVLIGLLCESCGLVDVIVFAIDDGFASGNALPTCAHNEHSLSQNNVNRASCVCE